MSGAGCGTWGWSRPVGHEHFRGCLTFPVLDAGDVGRSTGAAWTRPAAPPRHLYLPGPHRGVWNLGALASTDELVVTESIIDALTLWCAGFRHVTAAYGTGGWTTEHQQAVVEHGVPRVLIAFDADDAGDAGAKTLAAELASVGVESFRVELPRGTDVNEVAVAAKNPTGRSGGCCARPRGWVRRRRRRSRPPGPGSRLSLAASLPPGPSQSRPPRAGPRSQPESPWPAAVVAPGLDSPAHEVDPVDPSRSSRRRRASRLVWGGGGSGAGGRAGHAPLAGQGSGEGDRVRRAAGEPAGRAHRPPAAPARRPGSMSTRWTCIRRGPGRCSSPPPPGSCGWSRRSSRPTWAGSCWRVRRGPRR